MARFKFYCNSLHRQKMSQRKAILLWRCWRCLRCFDRLQENSTRRKQRRAALREARTTFDLHMRKEACRLFLSSAIQNGYSTPHIRSRIISLKYVQKWVWFVARRSSRFATRFQVLFAKLASGGINHVSATGGTCPAEQLEVLDGVRVALKSLLPVSAAPNLSIEPSPLLSPPTILLSQFQQHKPLQQRLAHQAPLKVSETDTTATIVPSIDDDDGADLLSKMEPRSLLNDHTIMPSLPTLNTQRFSDMSGLPRDATGILVKKEERPPLLTSVEMLLAHTPPRLLVESSFVAPTRSIAKEIPYDWKRKTVDRLGLSAVLGSNAAENALKSSTEVLKHRSSVLSPDNSTVSAGMYPGHDDATDTSASSAFSSKSTAPGVLQFERISFARELLSLLSELGGRSDNNSGAAQIL